MELCYVAETFTNLMKEYAVNHITSSPHYPQSNGLAEKFVQIIKNLFHKVKDEGTDIHKRLMIYRNMPLASTSKSPMQMLQQRSARSQLPMSIAARRELGIAVEQPSSTKNQHLPAHDFHIGQEVMCQSPITKRWFPATIKALCPEPRSYQNRNTRRDHVQENTKPPETIQVSPKDSNKRTISAEMFKYQQNTS